MYVYKIFKNAIHCYFFTEYIILFKVNTWFVSTQVDLTYVSSKFMLNYDIFMSKNVNQTNVCFMSKNQK